MFNKFWNFQKILGASMQFDKTKKILKSDFLSIFVFIISLLVLDSMFYGFSLIIYSLSASLFCTYRIINSNNKLYESLPVSKEYTYINIVLNPLASLTIMFLATSLVVLFEFVIKNLTYISEIDSFTGTFITPFLGEWNAVIFVGCIAIIIINILMPVFFIKRKTLRKILINSIVILATIIVVIKKTLPIYKGKGEIGFINAISTSNSLLILFCVCIVIIPISNFLSYKLYMGRSLKYD